jgi:hypothetical protein
MIPHSRFTRRLKPGIGENSAVIWAMLLPRDITKWGLRLGIDMMENWSKVFAGF